MGDPETIDAVDAATAAQADGGKREKSTIEFPYLDLDDTVEVAKAVHAVGGGDCRLEQLAAKLEMVVTGGGFRLRLLAAKSFGALTYNRDTVTLTALGQRLSDPLQEKQARIEAFLKVPLYSQVYEKFKGITLPQSTGLEQAMVGMGVAQKQKDKARQVFQRSANQAGFFAYGPDRLTMPSIKADTSANRASDDERPDDSEKNRKGGSGGGGGDHHPLIEGLIKALPASGENWPMDARKKWLQAAAMNFDFVYADPAGESKSIKVSLE